MYYYSVTYSSSLDYWGVQGPNHEPLPEVSSTNCLLFFFPLSTLNELDKERLETVNETTLGKELLSLEAMESTDGAIF